MADHVHIGWLSAFLSEAVIGSGVGSVLTFVPQIVLLFVLIAILEGTGYLARAAFLMDRVMGKAGLEAAPSSHCCHRSPAPSRASWRPDRCRRPATAWPP